MGSSAIWAVAAGGPGWDEGSSIAVDREGNVYVAGRAGPAATFGAIAPRGQGNMFVAKLDPAGRWIWVTRAEVGSDDRGYEPLGPAGIAVNGAGDCYVTGFARGGTFGKATAEGGFVAKLDSGGRWRWVVSDVVGVARLAIAADGAGGVFFAGRFRGWAARIGATTLTTYHVHTPGLVVAKAVDGHWRWVVATRQLAPVGELDPWGVAVDGAGNAHVVGELEGRRAFGPTTLTSSGSLFVAKLDGAGRWRWSVAPGAPIWGRAAIAVDAAGEAVLAGSFRAAALRFGATTLTNRGAFDLFAAKLDRGGTWRWAVDLGHSADGDLWFREGGGIWLDDAGTAHIAGNFVRPLRLGATPLTPKDGQDVFVAALDGAGHLAAASALGVPMSRLFVDRAGATYGTGRFTGREDFGPTVLTSAGDADLFVWKRGE